MLKSQFVSALAAKAAPLSQKDVEFVVNEVLDIMSDALARGERVEIRGFGSINLRHRKARPARNPKTGNTVTAPEKYVPHFTPGKALKERVAASVGTDIVQDE